MAAVARAFKWLAGILAVLLFVLVLAAGGLWWWTGTEGSLHWTLRQIAQRTPLVVEGARGTLRTGLQADRLAWAEGDLQVEARDVRLAWKPLSLLRRMLVLDELKAASVEVRDRRPQQEASKGPPDSLALPLQVAVKDLAIGRLTWDGATDVVAQDLAAGYSYDGTSHALDLRSLRMFDGHYRGRVRLGARGELPLDAVLSGRIAAPVPGGSQPLALEFEAKATGPLADLQAQLQAQGEAGGAASTSTRASVTAQITPWGAVPVPQARGRLQAFDAGALWAQAPRTSLSGDISVVPAGTGAWTISADLRNAMPGPWDRHRLPAEQVQFEGQWRESGQVLVRQLRAQLAGGRVQAQGKWTGEQAWELDASLQGINPAAVHTAMAALPVGGKATARAEGKAIAFDVDLRAAEGAARRPAQAPPASEVAAAVGALELQSVQARGRWSGDHLDLPSLSVRTSDASLEAAAQVDIGRRVLGNGRADLQAPGLRARAAGSLGETTGGGTVRASVPDAAAAQAWLSRLPGVPAAVADTPLAGRAEIQLAWQGGWRDPSVQGTLTVPSLTVGADGDAAWTVRDASARLDGRLADARLDLRAKLKAGARQGELELAGRGGQPRPGVWQAQVSELKASMTDPGLGPGPWRLALREAFDLRWASGTLTAGAGQAVLTAPARNRVGPPPEGAQAVLAWEPVRWRGGELSTAGRISGLPMAWVELLGGPQLAGSVLSGNLLFDGRWDVQMGRGLRLQAALERTAGDLTVLAENAQGGTVRVPAGVREARLTVAGEGESVTATLRWDSERAGSLEGRVSTQLSRTGGGGWEWSASAPLSGEIQARMPRLGVWSVLAPPGWRLRGSVVADVSVAGTRADPLLRGTVVAEDLALRSVVDGIELQGGRLRARLEGQRVVVEEFLLRGAGPDGGQLTATGEANWAEGGAQARATARLQNLRVSARDDRQLTVSGQVAGRVGPAGAEVDGQLRVDRALIVLPEEAAPRLGKDVVVRNAPPGFPQREEPRASKPPERPLSMNIAIDLGNNFRVRGMGIDTRLAGELTLSGRSVTEPRLNGVINTVGGEYRAYNQRLDIERGVLRFTGDIDNPALDVLAIRPRLEQRVGVQITGRAQAPFVRIYAEPDLPEAEKLSWLVLGRPSAAGGAEAALLQQAALALVASRAGGGGGGKGPAAMLGLDELGFKRDGADGPAVTLGKRLGRNLYATYERSLSGTLGTLFLFYDLSQRLTLRAQAGERAAVDLILTFRYD